MSKVFNSANSDAISTIHEIVGLKFNGGYNPKFALDTAIGFLKQKYTKTDSRHALIEANTLL